MCSMYCIGLLPMFHDCGYGTSSYLFLSRSLQKEASGSGPIIKYDAWEQNCYCTVTGKHCPQGNMMVGV